jgi:trimethylamine:corrinoid methyltransferase-like protein
MDTVRYHLTGGLSDSQCEQVVDEALRLLDEIGLLCTHEGIQDRLRGQPGVRISGDRFHFAPELCREEIARERIAAEVADESAPTGMPIKLHLVGPWTCLNVFDMDTRQIRPATVDDMVQATRLMESLGAPRGCCAPVLPSDVPDALKCLVMCQECWKWSAITGGGLAASVTEVRYAYRMAQVAEIAGPCLLVEYGISPLQCNARALDLVYQLLGQPELSLLAIGPGPLPSLGATAPIFVPGILSQSLAETLGGSLLVSLLTGGQVRPGIGAPNAIAFDMRCGTTNFSSPEAALLERMGDEVGSFLAGRPVRRGALRSISKVPDAQAAHEKTLLGVVQALHGARYFWDAGQLSIDDVFSFEQAVLDGEILQAIERFVNGMVFDDTPGLTGQTVADGVARGHFLDHDTTVERFRDTYWMPELLDRHMLGGWRAAGERDILDRARDVARERIAAQPPRLDEETQQELDRVFAAACRALA